MLIVYMIALSTVLAYFAVQWFDHIKALWKTRPVGFFDWTVSIVATVTAIAVTVFGYMALFSLT